MRAAPAAVLAALQDTLLPLLDGMLTADLAAAAPHSTNSTSSTSSSIRDTQHAAAAVRLDGRACAVIITAMQTLTNALKGANQSRQQQRALADDMTASAHRIFKLFLAPPVLSTATPQAFAMLAGSAAKLKMRSVSQRQLLALLQGLLGAAAAVQDSPAVPGEPDLLTPQHLSQTLWGVATLLSAQQATPPDPSTQQAMADVALLLTQHAELLASVKPVELCNTLSAFVICEGRPPPGLVADLVQALAHERNLSRAVPQDLGRVLWAVAKLDRGQDVAPEVCLRITSALCRSVGGSFETACLHPLEL
jgi:hypothetical protein